MVARILCAQESAGLFSGRLAQSRMRSLRTSGWPVKVIHMSEYYELRCRECGKTWGNAPRSFCEECFSPLEVAFDYDALKKSVRRENLAARSFNMWRYS